MIHNFIDLTGKQFNRWFVIKYVGRKKWFCRCLCGVEKEVYSRYLRNKTSQSCGCLANEKTSLRGKTHGMSHTRPYQVWRNMKNRCLNKNVPAYKHYGGRGITVCPRWKKSFDNFWYDMKHDYDKLLTLDRIDNNGNYQPDNCRWANKETQGNNTRVVTKITFNNETKTLTEWAKYLNINRSTLANRYFTYKWSIFDIINTPKLLNGRKHLKSHL
jgi:hypothetical protein